MIVGRVVGSVIATRKNEKLIGNKFMVVQPLDTMESKTGQLVAIDNIGAGIGEMVLVATGSAARIGCRRASWCRNWWWTRSRAVAWIRHGIISTICHNNFPFK